MSVPNMKLLCLILWLGEVCTDTNADANDANTKHDYVRLWLINQMSQNYEIYRLGTYT